MPRLILYRYAFILPLLTLVGCTELKKIRNAGTTHTGFETVYVNDSLKISSTFFGIFLPIEKKKQLRRCLKMDGLHVPCKFCMAFFRPDRPDTIIHDDHYYIFYFPDEKEGMKWLGVPANYMQQILLDSVKTEVMKFIYPDREGIIALVGNEPDPNKNFERVKENYLDYIFKQIRTDTNYTKYPTEDMDVVQRHFREK